MPGRTAHPRPFVEHGPRCASRGLSGWREERACHPARLVACSSSPKRNLPSTISRMGRDSGLLPHLVLPSRVSPEVEDLPSTLGQCVYLAARFRQSRLSCSEGLRRRPFPPSPKRLPVPWCSLFFHEGVTRRRSDGLDEPVARNVSWVICFVFWSSPAMPPRPPLPSRSPWTLMHRPQLSPRRVFAHVFPPSSPETKNRRGF